MAAAGTLAGLRAEAVGTLSGLLIFSLTREQQDGFRPPCPSSSPVRYRLISVLRPLNQAAFTPARVFSPPCAWLMGWDRGAPDAPMLRDCLHAGQ